METRYLISSKAFQILHCELLRQEGLLPYSPHGKLIEMGNRCVQGGRAELYLLGQNTNVYSNIMCRSYSFLHDLNVFATLCNKHSAATFFACHFCVTVTPCWMFCVLNEGRNVTRKVGSGLVLNCSKNS